MLAESNLEQTTKINLETLIEEERRAVAHEIVQFEASAQELSNMLEQVIRHPMRSLRQVIGPADIAGGAIVKRPFQAVGYAALAGFGAGLVIFQDKQAGKAGLPDAAASQHTSFAQNIGGIIRSEMMRLALVSFSQFLGHLGDRISSKPK